VQVPAKEVPRLNVTEVVDILVNDYG
jgi:hypothetical protein